ncbi:MULTISPECIES: MetQ/NlpA family ABC transporter substrate-binding protein [unclassified Acinetobacter]|uniref:MetQ/NlpA family ABC transporter substrate-binding protein n=1 Tax=unclassified Acinetobacter TaxID=196816 RepID=UPI002934C95E|nr:MULTISPECIES: MetQ/NlpA family ABC transporter substrate-binding protein [unclassified Acinetobacter]WOE32530.1 MetQ/NlpA family ABC transporter substrate-binding protein [Acinetobacter sp. SAAs470]WOE38006.1 MetQ/NlpA family ABC transporter substrate-binding protein [Acinetobacter sp. SAAs474]
MANIGKKNIQLLALAVVSIAVIIALVTYKTMQQQTSDQVLKIGISPPYADLLRSVAEEVKTQGIDVELIEFSDWQAPNVAVQHGDIDANFFQQSVFLANAIRETGYDLHAFAAGSGSHVGLYSKKYQHLEDIPQHGKVVIPSDPVNMARGLNLLARAGLIDVKDLNHEFTRLTDITHNPKQLQFIEVEGPQTAQAYHEADLILGFPHYLKLAKAADPQSALFIDPIDKKFAILFVTRRDYQDKEQKLATFVKTFQNSAKVRAILDRDFGQGMWFQGWK